MSSRLEPIASHSETTGAATFLDAAAIEDTGIPTPGFLARRTQVEELNESWWLPPQELSLFDTPWWMSASESQRRDHARHETAQYAGWIIQLELDLLAILHRVLRKANRETGLADLALEAADEWRHVRMFSQVLALTGAPASNGRLARSVGWMFRRSMMGRSIPFAVTYMLESYIVAMHDACLSSPTDLVPQGRQAHLRHARDEQRHLALAEHEIVNRWPRLNPIGRAFLRMSLPAIAAMVAHTAYCVPSDPSITRRDARRQVRRSEHHWMKQQSRFQRAYEFFADVGIVTTRSRRLWLRLHLTVER